MTQLSISAATRYGCVAAVWVAACGGAPRYDLFDPAADGSVSGRTATDAGTEVHHENTSDGRPSGPEVSLDTGVDRASPSGTNVRAGGTAGVPGQGGEGGTGGRGSGGAGVGGASGGGGSSAGGVAGQGGAADSGGDAGTGGGYVDAGPLGVCSYQNPITLFYRTVPRFDGVIDFAVKIVNDSTTSKALASLSARYYLSKEISNPAATVVYGTLCCPDQSLTWGVHAAIRPVVPVAPGADAFVEITFDEDAGWLDPGQLIEVEVEVRSQSGINANPTNDYSYLPTATGAQEQWDDCPLAGDCDTFRSCRVTVYDDGRLLWGQPPR